MLLKIEEYDRHIIFVHPPRSSGTSIEHSLLQFRRSTSPFLVPDSVKHYRASQIKALINKDQWDRAYKFGIVRNPFDLLASLYITNEANYNKYNMHAGKTITDFLLKLRSGHQCFWERVKNKSTTSDGMLQWGSQDIPMPWEHGSTCSHYMDEELDFIIKYENRRQDIGVVNQSLKPMGLKIDSNEVKRNHKTKKRDYMSYYDPTSKKIVEKLFEDDFERWYDDDI